MQIDCTAKCNLCAVNELKTLAALCFLFMSKALLQLIKHDSPTDLVRHASIVEQAGYKAGERVGRILSDLIDKVVDSVVSKVTKNG